MAVVRDDQFEEAAFPAYSDERYFKLAHHLKDIQKPELKLGLRLIDRPVEDFMKHIEECYDGEMDSSILKDYPRHPTYDASLWIAVVDKTGRIVGSAIGELDPEMKEGSLEWVEVSKDRRKQGIGAYLVKELLWRMRGKADFVTVSGKVNNPSNPEALYERCGFGGKVIWHILRK